MQRYWSRVSAALAIGCTMVVGGQQASGQTLPQTGGIVRPPTTALGPRSKSSPARVRQDVNPNASLNAEIVARVDDQVILLSEVLEPVRPILEMEKAKRSPEEYRELERQLLERVTQSLIERTVVLNELKLQAANPAGIELIRRQINEDFEKYLQSLVQKNGFESREALIEQLQKEGTSVEKLREDFIDRTMAEQFLNQLVRPQLKEPTRADLLRYYRDNIEEFTEEEGVIWSQIQVSFGENKDAAKEKILQAARELQSGADFAEVAKKYSDGPTAVSGGKWSLTSQGSYADQIIDRALFTLPVGEVSQVIAGKDAYHILRIDKRNDGRPTPFEQVQSQIRGILRSQGLGDLRVAKLKEIMAKHYVESIFDENNTQLSQTDRSSTLLK